MTRFLSTDASTIIVLIIFGLGILFIVLFVRKNVINERIKKCSPYYNGVVKANNNYIFNYLNSKDRHVYCRFESKSKYDSFAYNRSNYYNYLINYMADNIKEFNEIVKKIAYNRRTYNEYIREINGLRLTSDLEIVKECKTSIQYFQKKEKQFADLIIKRPQLNFAIIVRASYTSPAGRNHYERYCRFEYEEFSKIFEAAEKLIEERNLKIEREKQLEEIRRKKIEDQLNNMSKKTELIEKKTEEIYNSYKKPKKISSLDDLEEID